MAKSHRRWRLAKKILTWLFFYCGDRAAGCLCQQGQLAGGVDGHPRLQSDRPAQRRGVGDRQLFTLRLL